MRSNSGSNTTRLRVSNFMPLNLARQGRTFAVLVNKSDNKFPASDGNKPGNKYSSRENANETAPTESLEVVVPYGVQVQVLPCAPNPCSH